jgi:1-acyl-sn-glycerol-3-phosphate acyltransferase
MGLYGAIGVLGTVVYVALVLPKLFGPTRRESKPPIISLDRWCNAFLQWRFRHEKAVWAVTILILAVSLVGLTRLRFEGDVTKLNKLSPATKADEERFLSVWGDDLSVQAVARGRTVEESLRANDRIAEELVRLRQEKKILGFTSVAPMLPSSQTQLENLKRWQEFWTPQRLKSTRELLVEEGRKWSFGEHFFDPFFDDVVNPAPQPIALADFQETNLGDLGDMMSGYLAYGHDEHLVRSEAHMDNPALVAEVRSRLASAGAAVLHRQGMVEHMVGMVRDEIMLLGGSACAVILVLLFLLYGRVELVLTVFAPVALAIVVTLGSLGMAGVPLNLMSCLFVVFVLGMGIDYSIFLMSQRLSLYWGKGGDEAATMGAILLVAMASCLGFAAMCIASHPALFSLGLTGLIGMVTSLAGAAVIIPTVTDRLLSERFHGRAATIKTLFGGLYTCLYLFLAGLAYLLALRFLVALRYRQSEARQRFVRGYIRRVFNTLRLTLPQLYSRRILLSADAAAFQPPGVIVANHLALADLMMVLSLPCDMVLAVKRWVWDSWILGGMVRQAGYILIDGEDPEAFLQRGMEHLAKGTSVMMFPEGTRSGDGRIHRFRNGAFELAIRAQSDIIPLLLTNTQSCTLPGGAGVGDHRCLLRVLPRVTPQNGDYGRGPRALASSVRDMLLCRQAEDWRLAQEGRKFWSGIRSLYNYAGGYVENYVAWKMRLDPLFGRIDSLVPADGTVLDLGCGYGMMSAILARKSLKRSVIGVDYDSRKIDIARRTSIGNANANFLLEDLRTWPGVPAGTVLLVDVLHYWPREQQGRIIASVCQCLAPGGAVIFREGCRSDSWKHRLVEWGERFSTWIGHNRIGGGLHFEPRDFYVDAFGHQGLGLQKEMNELGPGSNTVLIFQKEAHA